MEFFSPTKNGLLAFEMKRSKSMFGPALSQRRLIHQVPKPKKSILKNKLYFCSFVLLFTCLIILVILQKSVFRPKIIHERKNRLFSSNFIIISLISSSGLTILSSWVMMLYILFSRKDAPVSDEFNLPKQYQEVKVIHIMQACVVLSCTLLFDLFLIIRSGAPKCNDTIFYFIPDWTCNPYAEVPSFPMDSAFLLILVPSIFALVMKGKRTYVTITSWLLSLAGLISSCAITNSTGGVLIIVFYCILSLAVFTDSFRMHTHMKDLHDNLKKSMEQNQELLDNQKMNQMKDMIGNVSHDLKTPLSSFMQGIDFMLDTLTEFERKLPPDTLKHDSFHQFFVDMKMHMKNIKNTNAFMLLTINRCIDFTKASKGLKLIPHLDTIDLLETLSLPMNCMKNIQDRIKISLLPIDNQIYNYIVTDKQWLQENVLCLLSNAVKYSTGGDVTVRLSIQREVENPGSLQSAVSFVSTIRTVKNDHYSERDTSSSSSLELAQGNGNGNETHHSPQEEKSHSTSMNQVKEYILFEIEDTGIGLSKEKMRDLFSPFGQAQKLAGGTGLGLYSLSKRIEALGGKFGVRGRKDGKTGSLFWFTIPYRPDHSVTNMMKAAGTSEGTNGTGKRRSSIDDQGFLSLVQPFEGRDINLHARRRSRETNASKETSLMRLETIKTIETVPEGNSLPPLSVLLIEDSPTIAKMTSMLLKKMGFHVSTAENGHIGLNMMMSADEEKKKYDLVLMDFQMPVMDGLEATRRYREYEKGKGISTTSLPEQILSNRQIIIGLSATCDPEIIEDAMKIGLDDYLMKPISSKSILKLTSKFQLQLKSTSPQ